MPRTSESARHTLAIVGNDVEVFERIRAPKGELTAEELVEFKRVVNCTPGDWFTPGNTAALVQYSRHVIAARRVAEAIEAAVRDGRFEELDMLLQVQARESKILLQLMTALRLTPRAVSPRSVSVKKLVQAPSPWRGPTLGGLRAETPEEQ